MSETIDLGHAVRYRPLQGAAGEPDGGIIEHTADCGWCSAMYDRLNSCAEAVLSRPVRTEPLTLDGEITCHCGLRGYVREGRWTAR